MGSEYLIRRAVPGDESTLAYIQTESWKAAFKNILSEEDLERCTVLDRATQMYRKLLLENKRNGYILELDGKGHLIAWWDRTREPDMPGYAEIICIHSLQDNWRKGFGSKMMDKLLHDIANVGYKRAMLWVFDENDRAKKFYEAKGFLKNGKAKTGLGVTEVMYIKDNL